MAARHAAGNHWLLLSGRQRTGLLVTLLVVLLVGAAGFVLESRRPERLNATVSPEMTLREMAPKLGVTGRALARELGLPLKTSKEKPVAELGVTESRLAETADHLRSHQATGLKYYLFVALVVWGLVFLVWLGRPQAQPRPRRWYPQAAYVLPLLVSVAVLGFVLGKSPNPMEGTVKVFKAMAGLYPSLGAKAAALVFFLALAVIGNKLVCGWACPFGALQELLYTLPLFRKVKRRKLAFVLTNSVRALLFIVTLLLLFGVVGGREGFVAYHYVNPFNLFDLEFHEVSILVTIVVFLAASLLTYRPFCHFVCPFGLLSWLVERLSLARVRVNRDLCTDCGACERACPTQAAEQILRGAALPADCFSCARCLRVCRTAGLRYGWPGSLLRR